MRFALIALSTFLFATALAVDVRVAGQQLGPAATVLTGGLPVYSLGSCPIAMKARPTASPILRDAENAGRPHTFAQHLQVDFSLVPSVTREVVAIDAHVQAFSGRLRFVPAKGSLLREPDQPEAAPVPFHTDKPVRPGQKTTVSWTLPQATGVDWVQLDRVTFADGSTWKRRGPDACKVSAAGFLPVD